jgi:hypothetical protein
MQEGEHFLGMFSQESAAARACDVAALKLHGASAQTNFPARLEPCSLAELCSSLQVCLFRNLDPPDAQLVDLLTQLMPADSNCSFLFKFVENT